MNMSVGIIFGQLMILAYADDIDPIGNFIHKYIKVNEMIQHKTPVRMSMFRKVPQFEIIKELSNDIKGK